MNAVPLRVDFAGGWLDVPRFARPGGCIVNCAISPLVSLDDWPYERGGGLGGSAAHAILQGRDPFASEDALGVGWQDPAVILETGLCVWMSGDEPRLEFKRDGEILRGRMGLLWTGSPHNTPGIADLRRDYDAIQQAGNLAREAVARQSIDGLAVAIRRSYQAQLQEGMQPLPEVLNSLARKYCGGGWGGYALYLFASRERRDASGLLRIEPFCIADAEADMPKNSQTHVDNR